jgi:hypothetical protein
MEPIEILSKFVGVFKGFSDPWRDRPFLAEPEFPFQDADVFWSVGTCGHTLMAYKGKIVEPMLGSPKLPFLWVTRDSDSIQVTRKELLEWAGVSNPGLIGFDDDPVTKLQGRILKVGFDLRKLAYLIENYPSENLYIWESTHVMHGIKSLSFDSEDGMWRGVLAGLDGKSDQKKVFQRSEAEYTDAFRMMLEM